jgi:hypothetical protein
MQHGLPFYTHIWYENDHALRWDCKNHRWVMDSRPRTRSEIGWVASELERQRKHMGYWHYYGEIPPGKLKKKVYNPTEVKTWYNYNTKSVSDMKVEVFDKYGRFKY